MPKLKNYYTPVSAAEWDHLCATGDLVPTRLMLTGRDWRVGRLLRGICLVNRPEWADDLARDHFRIPGRIKIVQVPDRQLPYRPTLPCCDYSPEKFAAELQAWVYTDTIHLTTSKYMEYEVREVDQKFANIIDINI